MKLIGFLKKFSNYKNFFQRDNRGFAFVMFVLLLPIIVYTIFLALSYAQMYSVQLKIRKALLKSAYAISKEIKSSVDYANLTQDAYSNLVLVAEKAFVEALGSQISTIQGTPIKKSVYKIVTGSSNKFISDNISSSQSINTSQISFVAESVLFSKIQIQNSSDFTVKSCSCSVGSDDVVTINFNKWIFPLYPATSATGFESMPYLDIRWEKGQIYSHNINWNCYLEFFVSEGTKVINDSNFGTTYSEIFIPQKTYSRSARIKLPYGSSVSLKDFKLELSDVSGKIHIKVSCILNFSKTDMKGTKEERVRIGRYVVVNTNSSTNVDLGIAVPLHCISAIKNKISDFINRLNIRGIQVAVVPYSSTVVAPRSFKDFEWIKTYKPNSVPVKEANVGDAYSIRFEIHNSYLNQCAKTFSYAKKIQDFNSCQQEDKESCSKHRSLGRELLYYPSIKHYFMRTANTSYPLGHKQIFNDQLFHSSELVSISNIYINTIVVSNPSSEWNNISGDKYMVINKITESGTPIAIANSIDYCAVCGTPKIGGACMVCGGSNFRRMSFFYSYGNLSNITDDSKISGEGYDELSVAFNDMSGALDNKSPKGCSLVTKNQSRQIQFNNIYIAVDSSGMHILATEYSEPELEGSGRFSMIKVLGSYKIWLTSSGAGEVSPESRFLKSNYYIYWNPNSLNTMGVDGNFNGSWQSLSNSINNAIFLENITENAKAIIFESCNCSEIPIVKRITCSSVYPYTCTNTLLNMDDSGNNVANKDVVFTTPVHYQITGGCTAELGNISEKELGSACLNGYVKYSIFYKLMDDLGIEKSELTLNTSASDINKSVIVEINKVPASISYKVVLQKLAEIGIPTGSFAVYLNGNPDTDYGADNAQNIVHITTLQGGDSKINYPGINVRDLYHSSGKYDEQDRQIFDSNVPNTNKIMYPIKSEDSLEYDLALDVGLSGPPIRLFWALNNKPCIGTHGNLTSIGGWNYNLVNGSTVSTGTLSCKSCSEPLDTHMYEMRLLSSNIIGMAFYVAMMSDSIEKSNFQYLGLIWAARMIHFGNQGMYYGTGDKVRDSNLTRKVLVFIATQKSGFFADEMTHLGLLKDDGDAVLNNSSKNLALGTKQEETTTALLNMSANVMGTLESEISTCDLYAISYKGTLDSTIRPMNHGNVYDTNSPDELESALTKIEEDIIFSSTGSRITVIE